MFENYGSEEFRAQKDALDIAVMGADWTYSNNSDVLGVPAASAFCNQVGEVLEAMGRFSEAAAIYSDAGDLFASIEARSTL